MKLTEKDISLLAKKVPVEAFIHLGCFTSDLASSLTTIPHKGQITHVRYWYVNYLYRLRRIIMSLKNLCDTCKLHIATCSKKYKPQFGLKDNIIKCSGYIKK